MQATFSRLTCFALVCFVPINFEGLAKVQHAIFTSTRVTHVKDARKRAVDVLDNIVSINHRRLDLCKFPNIVNG